MGFLSALFGKRQLNRAALEDADLVLLAPVSGTLLPLSEVPDIVISEKIVGDGIAIVPSGQEITAPCDGIISRILSSRNAFALRAACGVEIYVTCGIGMLRFKGEGFCSSIKSGDEVRQGQTIISVDMARAGDYLKSTITSLIVVNSSADIARVSAGSGRVEGGRTPCAWVVLNHEEAS